MNPLYKLDNFKQHIAEKLKSIYDASSIYFYEEVEPNKKSASQRIVFNNLLLQTKIPSNLIFELNRIYEDYKNCENPNDNGALMIRDYFMEAAGQASLIVMQVIDEIDKIENNESIIR